MPEIELIEVTELLLMFIATTIFVYTCRKRKDLIKWVPAFVVFTLAFLCTNLEALASPDAFNNFEHIFYMLGGVFMFSAVLIDFVKIFLTPKAPEPTTTTNPKRRK